MVHLVEAVRHLLERERGRPDRLRQRAFADQGVADRRHSSRAEQATQGATPSETAADQLADRRFRAGIRAEILGIRPVMMSHRVLHPLSVVALPDDAGQQRVKCVAV